MPVREQQVESALRMFPQRILKRMLNERDMKYESQKIDDLVDELLTLEWSQAQFDDLKERLADIERERNPKRRYIKQIDAVNPGLEPADDIDRACQVLKTDPAVFDDSGDLLEEGFELRSQEETAITGSYWTESVNYSLTPTNEIKVERTVYETGFELDLESNILFVDANLAPKASGLVGALEAHEIETSNVGHESLMNSLANEMVQGFVDDLATDLREQKSQATLNDDFDRDVVDVGHVKMLLDDNNLEDIRIGGRTDIINHPEVENFREDYDSRIVRLEGEFEFENKWFKFTAGHSVGMGQISVEKKGKIEERPEMVDRAFEFLHGFYREYFIDV